MFCRQNLHFVHTYLCFILLRGDLNICGWETDGKLTGLCCSSMVVLPSMSSSRSRDWKLWINVLLIELLYNSSVKLAQKNHKWRRECFLRNWKYVPVVEKEKKRRQSRMAAVKSVCAHACMTWDASVLSLSFWILKTSLSFSILSFHYLNSFSLYCFCLFF